MKWLPIDQAPKGKRILLKYDISHTPYVMGRWNDDEYGKPPRPYWTNDLERIRGKMATRSLQPTHYCNPEDIS